LTSKLLRQVWIAISCAISITACGADDASCADCGSLSRLDAAIDDAALDGGPMPACGDAADCGPLSRLDAAMDAAFDVGIGEDPTPACGDAADCGVPDACDGGADCGVPDPCDGGADCGVLEACDGGADCAAPICGDGVVTGTEVCDDRNAIDGDYCAADCTVITGACGDGLEQPNEGCGLGQIASCAEDCIVRASGSRLVLAGALFHRIGVNTFSLFFDALGMNVAPSSECSRDLVFGDAAVSARVIELLDTLERYGFDTARVALGFYPDDLGLWVRDRDAYWRVLDGLVNAARARGIRLVLTLAWNRWLFPDLASTPSSIERLNALADPGSRSRALLAEYVTDVVSRYARSSTILAWELVNELNLIADIGPPPATALVAPCWGTPASRTADDVLTSAEIAALQSDLAALVRSIDPIHLVSSGHSAPRPSAWHLARSTGTRDWTLDSRDQMFANLAEMHPDPIDLVSVHIYDAAGNTATALHENERYGHTGIFNPSIVSDFLEGAERIGKPLLVGEFGDNGGPVPIARDPRGIYSIRVALHALERRVPLALFWSIGFYRRGSTLPFDSTIVPDPDDPSDPYDPLASALAEINAWTIAADDTPGYALAVSNGGFETDAEGDGAPDGWITWGIGCTSTSTSVRVDPSDLPLREGRSVLRIAGGSGAPCRAFALSPPIAVTPSSDVVVSALVRGSGLESGDMRVIEYEGTTTRTESPQPIRNLDDTALGIVYRRVQLGPSTDSIRIRFGAMGADMPILDVDDLRAGAID
jgi:cysteine-rich repeat protein